MRNYYVESTIDSFVIGAYSLDSLWEQLADYVIETGTEIIRATPID